MLGPPQKLVEEIQISLRSIRLKRITAWAVTCNSCSGQELVNKKPKAFDVAVKHAKTSHLGQARIEVRS